METTMPVRDDDGRYSVAMDRLCRCGHTKGIHAAGKKGLALRLREVPGGVQVTRRPESLASRKSADLCTCGHAVKQHEWGHHSCKTCWNQHVSGKRKYDDVCWGVKRAAVSR